MHLLRRQVTFLEHPSNPWMNVSFGPSLESWENSYCTFYEKSKARAESDSLGLTTLLTSMSSLENIVLYCCYIPSLPSDCTSSRVFHYKSRRATTSARCSQSDCLDSQTTEPRARATCPTVSPGTWLRQTSI